MEIVCHEWLGRRQTNYLLFFRLDFGCRQFMAYVACQHGVNSSADPQPKGGKELPREKTLYLLERERLGPDRRGEGVGGVVGPDPESSQEGTNGSHDHDPQPLVRCFGLKQAALEVWAHDSSRGAEEGAREGCALG